MVTNIIKIQAFRKNDLVNDAGKQFEVGKAWCDEFFEFDETLPEVVVNLTFKALQSSDYRLNDRNIELKLSNVSTRGDRKAYINGPDGMSQIKHFFINELRLTYAVNKNDYFAIYKDTRSNYFLYFVPNILYKNFLRFFESFSPAVSISPVHELLSVDYLDKPLQRICYGAPGAGKSFQINNDIKDHDVIRTTFHPDSDYSTFVGTYKPKMEGENIVYKFVKQAFLKAYLYAWKKYADGYSAKDVCKPQFLVVEEINRGNCAQIFGDIFQLLDRGDNLFSCYPIEVDTDIQLAIADAFKEEEEYKLLDEFNVDGVIKNYKSSHGNTLTEDIKEGYIMLLPPNLYIWATMNTSDQSLFPIDSAFKRRWDWEYVPIDYEDAKLFTVKFKDDKTMKWSDFLEVINFQIMDLMHNADKQIGNRFISLPEGQTEISSDVFFNKVMFYLWSEIYKDYYEDENSIFRYEGDNISFEDIASSGNRDKIIVAILKSLKGKDDKIIEVTESRTSTE